MLKRIALWTALSTVSGLATAEIINTDSSISHKMSSQVFYSDNSYQIFFKKPALSNNYIALQHACEDDIHKNRFFIEHDEYFDIKKELIADRNIVNFGYECADYKDWGVVPMIKIIRVTE